MTDRQHYYRQMEYLLVFFIAFLFLAFWQFHLAFGDPDVFYHTAIAQLLSEGTLLRSLPWMQFTTLTEHFTDHHLLYHLLLAPLMRLGNPLYAVKLGTILFGAGFFTTFYWYLRRITPHLALVWTALLLFSSSFSFRLALVKANSVSLIVMVVMLYALQQKKTWLLFWMQIVYVWLYGGWVLGILIAGLYWLIDALAESRSGNTLRASLFRTQTFHGLIAVVVGSCVGVVLNPYWPYNVYFYWQQVVQIAIINYGSKVGVGGEWYSLSWRELINFHLYPLIVLVLVGLFGWRGWRRLTRFDWFLVTLAIISMGLTWKSRRYIELSAPLMSIATAVLWLRCMSFVTWGWIKRQLSLSGSYGLIIKVYSFIVIVFIAPALFLFIIQEVVAIRSYASETPFAVNQLANESQWLQEHSKPGEVIFHSEWDYWPALFYYNRYNHYIVGLDPTFMYNKSPELWQLWSSVSSGEASGDFSQIIINVFRARFVLVSNTNEKLIKLLSEDKKFVLRYQGSFAKIFEIVKHE